MDKWMLLPPLALVALTFGMLVLSSTLSWIYYVGYYRRVRAGLVSSSRPAPSMLGSLVMHRAPWMILLLAALVCWLQGAPESAMRTWLAFGLAASVFVFAIVALLAYRRLKAGPPLQAPDPGNPWWPRR